MSPPSMSFAKSSTSFVLASCGASVLALRARGELLGLDIAVRMGSYRVIYQVIDADRTVRVAAIRHRSTAYGNDPR